MAATTLTPFQPPAGLAPREALAHAHNHIEKLTKKHETVARMAKEYAGKFAEAAKQGAVAKHAGWVGYSALTTATSATLGYVNGRHGGERGVLERMGIPLDGATAGLLHATAVGMAVMHKHGEDEERDKRVELAVRAVHTVADAALGVTAYRWALNKGVEGAKRANAGAAAQTNGAPRGTVYNVTPGAPPHR